MTEHSENTGFNSVSSEFDEMVELYDRADDMQESKPSEAMVLAKRALDIANHINSKEYQYYCNHLLGCCELSLYNLNNAHTLLSRSLNIVKQYFIHDKEKSSTTYNTIGIVYFWQNNIEFALDYFTKALQFEVEKDKLKIYNNLGNVYSSSEKHQKALEYYDLALQEAKTKKDAYSIATLLLNISKSLLYYKNFDLAKKNIKEALCLTDEHITSDTRFILLRVHILLNLTELYISKNNFDKASRIINETLAVAHEISAHRCYCRALYYKTNIQLKKESEETALPLVHQTLEYATQHQLCVEKKNMLEQIIEFYERFQQYDKAYPFLKEFQSLRKKELECLREQNFKRILSGRKQEIESLKNKDKDAKDHSLLLEQFAHIISHDLKEPIRNIVSFSSLLDKRYASLLDDDGREFLKYVINGATTMDQNLNRLLDFMTLKVVEDKAIQKINFSHIKKELLECYKATILPFKISINIPSGYFSMVYGHAYTLFDELVSNAIKFRKKNQDCIIEISSKIEDGKQHISIKDYGIGLEPKFGKQIFKIFNRLNKREYDGSGVGLAICERIIQLYRGEIWIESELDMHTTIHILIPVKR